MHKVARRRRLVVVCPGGGGIPVVNDNGALRGVEAVTDKDLSAALLAGSLGAGFLLLLTDVDAVERDWGRKRTAKIGQTTSGELRRMRFESGSMARRSRPLAASSSGPGGIAAIGALGDAAALLRGETGTRVAPSRH